MPPYLWPDNRAGSRPFQTVQSHEPPHHLRVRLLHIRQIDRLQNGTADSASRTRCSAGSASSACRESPRSPERRQRRKMRRRMLTIPTRRAAGCAAAVSGAGTSSVTADFSGAGGLVGFRRFHRLAMGCGSGMGAAAVLRLAGALSKKLRKVDPIDHKRAEMGQEAGCFCAGTACLAAFCGCRAEFGQNIVNRLLLQLRRKAASAAQEQVIQLRIRLIQGQKT